MTNEQRIEQLVRRCRWLFAALAGLAVVGGVAVFSGAAPNNAAKNLRVESLEILDTAGKVRVRLGDMAPQNVPQFKDGIFGLQVSDANGAVRATVQDRAQFILEMDDGRAVVAASPKGASVQLNGRGGSPRLMLSAQDDHCDVQLRDTNGEVAWQQATPRLKVDREAGAGNPFK
jgi:hypothetical protein